MEKLSTVLNYTQPTNYIVKDEVYNDEYSIPVLTAGKSFLLGYTNEKKGIFTDIPTIIFDDFTTSFHYVDFPFKVKSSAMKMLTPKRNDVHLKYVYYQMLGKKVDTRRHKRYWISQFSKLKIPLPPLPVQEKIASILDDAAALRDKTEQLLTEYDLLAQSIFLEMFGDPGVNSKKWQLIKIKDISNIDKKVVKPEDIRSGERHIGLDSIEKDTGEIVNVEIVEAGSIKSNKYFFTENHILYGRLRPYLNKVANPDFSGICSTDIITLLPKKSKTNKEFLTLFLRGDWHLNWANLNTTGANLPRLNLKAFSDYEIPVPPLDLQNQFAEKVQLIERQKEIVRQELKESEDLFQALLQQAFKGELV